LPARWHREKDEQGAGEIHHEWFQQSKHNFCVLTRGLESVPNTIYRYAAGGWRLTALFPLSPPHLCVVALHQWPPRPPHKAW
jgi:hypothetical protein